MKTLKKIFSMLLCAALLLSSAPIFNFGLFRTEAAAVSYAKIHTKEYYYAPGTQFVSFLATGGDRDGNTAKAKVTDSSYSLIDKNLNAGVRVSSGLFSSRDADEVYLGYKTSSDPTVSIRDLRIMLNKSDDRYTCPENGAAYTLVSLTPVSEKDNDGGGSVDLNQSKSSADYLHYFATKDVRAGAPIVSITINNNDSQAGYETVKYLNSDDFNLVADANRDAGGEYIYTHLTRLPEVDTTALRSTMETADTYITNSHLYVDITTLTNARDNAKKIIDSYDNYAAGYEAFGTAYNQAAIDNAKNAIDNAIKALLTKLDWTAFNAAVSKANGLNKNDYVDFSSVENALKNADLVKNGFSTQEQVDGETAKINAAVNALVKKSTTKSFVQGNADGHDSGWTFQSSVSLEIFNVNSGTDCDYWNTGAGVDRQNGEEYEKTAQYTADKWNASKATIYVDPDVNSDILSTGVYVSLTMPWVHSELNRARWGVELAAYQNNYTMGILQNNWRTVTVQSTNGKSLTYALCDQNGNDKASAQTSNGDFTVDQTISDGKKGPYYWYIKGAVPAAGDKVTVRVLGICAAWAHSGNVQKLTEFTDLTIVSVSKTALKKAIYTVVGNESVYTSDSYTAYVTALNAAKAVLNDATAEQTTVDAATTKLNNAIGSLKAKLDMSALYAARDKANSLNGSDYEDFSEVANLVNMIPNTVFNTQQEVNDYADRLNYAIAKLVKKGDSLSGSVKSEQKTVYAGLARANATLTASKASFVTSDVYTNYESDTADSGKLTYSTSYSNSHGGDDFHRAYQRGNDSSANAYYVFDRYSNKSSNVSSLGNVMSLYLYGEAKSHQQSFALYDSAFIESSVLSYETSHTSVTTKGSKSGKSYSYSMSDSGLYCNWEDTQYKTTEKNITVSGAVPDVGDTVSLRPVYRNAVFCFNNTTGLFYYGWVTLNFVAVDSTALRNAIALSKNVLDKSAYSESSYNAYRTALSEASEALNGSAVPNQDNYNAKTAALINAINNLERIQTVTLDSQSATTAGTTSVVATIGKAMPSITLPTREHYSFDGYFTQPNGEGVRYYNADGSSARVFDLESDVTLYASWSIDKFDIKFVNSDGTVLRSGKVAYGTKPVYDGDEPSKVSDDGYQYTFSGWSPEITEVTADATYTAQFTEKAHRFYCSIVDDDQHEYVCMDCNYKKPAENHNYVYTKIDSTRYGYKCADCGNCRIDGAVSYDISFPEGNGTVVKKEIRYDLSLNYYIATIQAPLYSGNKYFAYWVDGATGEKVSTYRTYSFFLTGDRSFVPVYVEPTEYTAERNSAVFSSTVAGVKAHSDNSYSLYAEHSVAKTIDGFPKYDPNNRVESINKIILRYGVIYTADSAYIATDDAQAMESVLVCGGADVVDKPAGLSDKTRDLTGVFEVKVETGSEAIWARTYVVDANGEIHYGMPKKLNLTAATASADDEIITLSSESYGSTDLNVEGDALVTEPEAPTAPSFIETVTAILTKLADIINKIIEFFTKSGVRI